MNGEPTDSEFDMLDGDPLGIIPPPPPVSHDPTPISFCEECGGIGLHLSHCPVANQTAWLRKEERRDAVREAADASLPRLALMATRRVAARVLRRIARSLDA
jgi:hypothetical protein